MNVKIAEKGLSRLLWVDIQVDFSLCSEVRKEDT